MGKRTCLSDVSVRCSMNSSWIILVFMIAGAASGLAQGREVQGQVLDEQHQPVPGANVLIMGTANGTVTDSDGKFKISLPGGTSELLFAFIGFKQLVQPVTIDKQFAHVLEVTLVSKEIEGRKRISLCKFIPEQTAETRPPK
jgi:hypothetical protein